MITVEKVKALLEELAPIRYSQEMVKNGAYDNSGLLINTGEDTSAIYMMLDLTVDGVKKAVEKNAKIIITHHPAIYNPVSSLSIDDVNTNAVLLAIKNGISVFSMHLNLDTVKNGIDDSLADGLSFGRAKCVKVIDCVLDNGYGKEVEISPTDAETFVENVKKEFESDKIVAYINKGSKIRKFASFCGGGTSSALSYNGDADVIITSDVNHRGVKAFIEGDKQLIILPHYIAENYGFKRFYERVKQNVDIDVYYFDNARYR